jgi:hypothetical protein
MQVEHVGSYSGDTWIDKEVKLFKAGSEHGTGKNGSTFTDVADALVVFGGESDVWGGTWAAADLNSTTFGTGYIADINNLTGPGSNVQIDAHWCNVHFTLPAGVVMAMTAGTAINKAGADNDWSNPGNAATIKNRSRATSTTSVGTPNTDFLEISNFAGLQDIPDGATIDGIRLRIHKLKSFGTAATDESIRLMTSTGTYVGSDKADTSTGWPTGVGGWTVYGGSADTWSASLTAAQVKASTFGVAIQADGYDSGVAAVVEIDAVELTVWYTEASGDGEAAQMIQMVTA